jgi:hypothetical protein
MTTIRAHVPVETPAGLVVAFPPAAAIFSVTGAIHQDYQEFDLAVPCPTCVIPPEMAGLFVLVVCPDCRDGYVLHGRYRVLDVLPVCDDQSFGIRCVWIDGDDVAWLVEDYADQTAIDLPAAVPGGVALIVEAVE